MAAVQRVHRRSYKTYICHMRKTPDFGKIYNILVRYRWYNKISVQGGSGSYAESEPEVRWGQCRRSFRSRRTLQLLEL